MNEIMHACNHGTTTYYGARGTVTGRLHWNPLVYPCKNGSKWYLFQVDVVCRAGNENNSQLQDCARFNAYVPAQEVENNPFAQLQQGSLVTVWYVVQTDTYFDASCRRVSKTYLRVRDLHLHSVSQHTWKNANRNPADSGKRYVRFNSRQETQAPQATAARGSYSIKTGAPSLGSSFRSSSFHS